MNRSVYIEFYSPCHARRAVQLLQPATWYGGGSGNIIEVWTALSAVGLRDNLEALGLAPKNVYDRYDNGQ